jgi:hypothetical protein
MRMPHVTVDYGTGKLSRASARRAATWLAAHPPA